MVEEIKTEETKPEKEKTEETKPEKEKTEETKKVFQGTVNGKPYKGARLAGFITGHCNKCNHNFEQNLRPAGEIVKCPKCQNKA